MTDKKTDTPRDPGDRLAPKWLVGGAAGFVAVVSAITAVLGFTLTELGNRSLRYKSQALDHKTIAVRQWNEHQAVRTKRNIAELAIQLLPPDKGAPYRARLKRYGEEEKAALARAQRQEQRADDFDTRSEKLLEPRQLQVIALILLQISVALGSISILAKSPHMLWLGMGSATAGVVLAVIGGLAL